MSKILFCAKGSADLGLGHIYRTMRLALNLSILHSVHIVCTENHSVKKLVQRNEIPVSYVKDFKNSFPIIEEFNPTKVVLDLQNNNRDFISELRKNKIQIYNIEDRGIGRYLSNVVFDANITEEENKELCQAVKSEITTEFHLGPNYAILDEEFSRYYGNPQPVRKNVQTILVTFGGSDPKGLTLKTLIALKTLSEIVNIIVVIGPAFKDQESLKTIKHDFPNFIFLRDVKFMYEPILSTDIVICSGGVTLYEAACLGKPAIVLNQVEHQVENARRFEGWGAALNLGLGEDLIPTRITDKVRKLMANFTRREYMSQAGRERVDGMGLSRVARIISKENHANTASNSSSTPSKSNNNNRQ